MYVQQLSSSRASAILQHCLFADMASTAVNAHFQIAMDVVKALQVLLDWLEEALRASIDTRQERIQEVVMSGSVGVVPSPIEIEDEDRGLR